MSYLAFVAAASVGLGLIDLPRPRLEGRRQWAEEFALALIAIAAVGIAFAYLSGVQPAREQYRLIYPGLLVVAYTMFVATWHPAVVTARSRHRSRRVMALPAIGAVSLLLCVLRGEVEDRLTRVSLSFGWTGTDLVSPSVSWSARSCGPFHSCVP